MTWKEDWQSLKKELTWNNIKIVISAGLPLGTYLYGYTFWMKFVSPFMQEYSKTTNLHDATLTLFATISFIAPLGLLFAVSNFGLYIGYITKFYRSDKTRRLTFDDKEYFIMDMPDDQREQIKQILSIYKSKLQIRKEAKANQSWFRRNFT